MLIAGIITGSSASKLKQDARLLASDAYRTKVLFDTDKLLENTDDPKTDHSIMCPAAIASFES